MHLHKYLVISSTSFCLPGLLYLYSTDMINSIIGISILITALTSINFWYDGKQHSIKHKIDSMWIRFELLLLNAITLFNKYKQNKKLIIFCLVLLLAICLLYSDYFSSIQWCSTKHVYTHLMTHIVFITMLIAYYI